LLPETPSSKADFNRESNFGNESLFDAEIDLPVLHSSEMQHPYQQKPLGDYDDPFD